MARYMNLTSFNTLLVPMRNKLYRLALRITGSGAEAEDVVQDVFEKIWTKRDTPAHTAVQNWEAMSMTMTRNLSIDRTRAKRHQVMGMMPEGFEQADASELPDEVLQASEAHQRVALLVAALPEKQRTVLHLRDVEEYTYDQIAETLQISMDDVKVNLHRARKNIRERLLLNLHP
jgi:RNA polymerase sigma factor (sigma-70 family)